MIGIQTFLKKSRISKILVSAIIPLVLLLSFLGSNRKVYADEEVSVVNPPIAIVIPDYNSVDSTSELFTFYLTINGSYSRLQWEIKRPDQNSWTNSNVTGFSYTAIFGSDNSGIRYIRVKVFYLDEFGVEQSTYSNTVTAFNTSVTGNNDIVPFTVWGTVLLSRFIEWFNIFLDWMIDNPIVFVFLTLAIIISSIGTLRHVIGGSHEKKDFSY